jgi:hypothetical protein
MIFRAKLEELESRLVPAITYTVDLGGDAGAAVGGVADPADATKGDLRYCLTQANTGGNNTVAFNLPAGSTTIYLMAPLPTLTASMTIDGSTQPGFQGLPIVEVRGPGNGGFAGDGFVLTNGQTTLDSLIINGFNGDGVKITTEGGDLVQNCYIGTDYTGTLSVGLDPFLPGAARYSNLNGVEIDSVANNTIGGTSLQEGNLISGNLQFGVYIHGTGATGNVLGQYFIGATADGLQPLGNLDGVRITDASNNTVGGAAGDWRNLISGNTQNGVLIEGGQSHDNVVAGNLIGTDWGGLSPLPNNIGVQIAALANKNLIGGVDSTGLTYLGNVISGINDNGVAIVGMGTQLNRVVDNYIGLGKDGVLQVANGNIGVLIDQAKNNTIGGTGEGEGNVISGNSRSGVQIQNLTAIQNLVQGNLIGTDASGLISVGNFNGVFISDASSNTIGGVDEGARNVISGNQRLGVGVVGSDANLNLILGNYIGVNSDGTAGVGNGYSGIEIYQATNTTIGGAYGTLSGNVISGNGFSVWAAPDNNGITLFSAKGTIITGNRIGTDAAGLYAIGNANDGVFVDAASTGNTIGFFGATAENLISANHNYGIEVAGANNSIDYNWVGVDANGLPLNNWTDWLLNTNPTTIVGTHNVYQGMPPVGSGGA